MLYRAFWCLASNSCITIPCFEMPFKLCLATLYNALQDVPCNDLPCLASCAKLCHRILCNISLFFLLLFVLYFLFFYFFAFFCFFFTIPCFHSYLSSLMKNAFVPIHCFTNLMKMFLFWIVRGTPSTFKFIRRKVW